MSGGIDDDRLIRQLNIVEIYEGSRRWVCGAPMIMDSLEAASGGQVQYQYYLQDRLRSFKKLRIEESRISGSKKTISHNSHLRKALTN